MSYSIFFQFFRIGSKEENLHPFNNLFQVMMTHLRSNGVKSLTHLSATQHKSFRKFSTVLIPFEHILKYKKYIFIEERAVNYYSQYGQGRILILTNFTIPIMFEFSSSTIQFTKIKLLGMARHKDPGKK